MSGEIPYTKQKYVPTSGTYPRGFSASGTFAGVKPSNTGTPDVALIVSDVPCSAAAVFTRNKFQAAPVQVSKKTLSGMRGCGIRAVVVNSGCANAVTGQQGMGDARMMREAVDNFCFKEDETPAPTRPQGEEEKEVEEGEVGRTLVMSTGVIGQPLPIDKIVSAIPEAHSNLSSEHESWLAAAKAICTTDTFPKLLSREFHLPSSPDITYRIVGMTKGAGMIHPNMATLLGIMCTDAPIAPGALRYALRHAMHRSFNCISIDGDTSTNDTVAILANGAAVEGGGTSTTIITRSVDTQADLTAFQTILTEFSSELAQLVVRDGEGATKFVTVKVTDAPSYRAARSVAKSISCSPLVKTALYGKDANWGRILCAVGYAPTEERDAIIPEQTSVSFIPCDGSEELKLLVNGEPQKVDEERAKEILEQEDLEIKVRLRNDDREVVSRNDGPEEEKKGAVGVGVEEKKGEGEKEDKGGRGKSSRNEGDRKGHRRREVTFWTCDFSHEYVTINGDYRT
ncbi:MAG: Pyridoxal 5'-phosphate synthase subunit snz1 [Watsoniomyces obsoletus]|nr:MAG: Pyridoxal 5'-phosphate synthase subunit snz1 [Watsoniomyces obsoletus]